MCTDLVLPAFRQTKHYRRCTNLARARGVHYASTFEARNERPRKNEATFTSLLRLPICANGLSRRLSQTISISNVTIVNLCFFFLNNCYDIDFRQMTIATVKSLRTK